MIVRLQPLFCLSFPAVHKYSGDASITWYLPSKTMGSSPMCEWSLRWRLFQKMTSIVCITFFQTTLMLLSTSFSTTWRKITFGAIRSGRFRRPRYPYATWGVHDRVLDDLTRTNNAVEGWHNRFNQHVCSVPISLHCCYQLKFRRINKYLLCPFLSLYWIENLYYGRFDEYH